MLLLPILALSFQAGWTRIEAEIGALQNGVRVETEVGGFTGGGYLTGFEAEGASVRYAMDLPPGIYEVRLRYRSEQPKGFVLESGGYRYSGHFLPTGEEWKWHDAGRVELIGRPSDLTIERGWGFFDLDALEVRRIETVVRPKPVPARLVTPNASAKAQAVMRRLTENYGKRTVSGQYGLEELVYLLRHAERAPAIIGEDLMDYSPSRVERGADPKGLSEKLIEMAGHGHWITLSWHWNAPSGLLDKEYEDAEGNKVNALWWRGFYSNATTFDVSKAMSDPSSEEHRLILRDIDEIAKELKKFRDADVPVLWRPLHEADGAWFWWGAKGPKPYIALWRLMFDRLTHHHGLNNLIWVSSAHQLDWHVGDAYVDVIGVDAYPADGRDPVCELWDRMLKAYDGKKLIALTEFGGAFDVPRAERFGVRYSYFVTWSGDLGPKMTPTERLKAIYQSPLVVTHTDLVKWSRDSSGPGPGR